MGSDEPGCVGSDEPGCMGSDEPGCMGSDEPAHGSPHLLAQHSPIFVCVQYSILKLSEYLYMITLGLVVSLCPVRERSLCITLNCEILLLANLCAKEINIFGALKS